MLALVPAGTGFPFDAVPPPLPRAAVTPAQVTSSAAGALTMFLSTVMTTLEAISRTPLATLKNGGVGVRELSGLAKRLGIDAADLRLTLALASPLTLIEQDSSAKLLRTTGEFERWRKRSPDARAAGLVLTWKALTVTPVLDRDEEGAWIPALAVDARDLSAPMRRFAMLAALRSGPADSGIVSVAALAEFLSWQAPLAVPGLTARNAACTWAEAESLGVVAHGGLSPVGRAVVAEDTAALVDALIDALPPVQRTALFGSDLTVVVPGSPAADVVDLLDAVAIREARGAASTWRVTVASVRCALDDGYGLDDLVARLRRLAGGELPQALEYLVRDVGRRYGAVAVGPSNAVLVGDEALLAEMEVHRALRQHGLRRVAPTVLVASSPPDVVVVALRGAGYLPRQLDETGGQVIRVGARSPRAQAMTKLAYSGPHVEQFSRGEDADDADDDADDDAGAEAGDTWDDALAELATVRAESPARAAERLKAGLAPPENPLQSLVTDVEVAAKRLSPTQARLLATAISTGQPIRIAYWSSQGLAEQVLSGLTLTSGYLTSADRPNGVRPTFALAAVFDVGRPGPSAGMAP